MIFMSPRKDTRETSNHVNGQRQMSVQGPQLRLPGRQCDQKFSSGDQNFVVGRQLATGKAGCHFRLLRSEKMIKN